MSHNFPVNRENTFTAKEAVNLLEGAKCENRVSESQD